jgi:hypothetical protein
VRAYRKTTQHPYCLYFDTAEAAQAARELERLDPEDFPALAKVERHLARIRGAAGDRA